MTVIKGIVFAFLAVVVIFGLTFVATGGNLAVYEFWAPKQANAERKVFENTQSYVEGKQTYIGRLCRHKSILGICLFAAMLPLCAFDDQGCEENKSDNDQRVQIEVLSNQGNAQVGMPGITNFTEKRIMRRLYEMRDQNVATFTYMPDMNGKLWHICDSMGYGLPYGTQFSNPEKITNNTTTSYGTLPQAEPNGLFMPPGAEGTWVICASTKGEFTPIYIEPRVIVSPFRLRSEGDYALPNETNEALKKTVTSAPYIPAIK